MLFQLIYSYHEIMSFTPEKKVGSIPCFSLYLTFSDYLDRVIETAPRSNFSTIIFVVRFHSLKHLCADFSPII